MGNLGMSGFFFKSHTEIKVTKQCSAKCRTLCMGFLSHDIYDSQDSWGRGMQFLISLYRFHPLHEHWHISQAITAESSPLHMASGWTRKRNLWPRPFECDAEPQITYENAKQEIIWADNFDSSFNTIVAGKEPPFSIYTECLIVI